MKIGAKVVSHGRYVTFQTAEAGVPRQMFADIPVAGRPGSEHHPRPEGTNGIKCGKTTAEVRLDAFERPDSALRRGLPVAPDGYVLILAVTKHCC
jgi:hypothetical protein